MKKRLEDAAARICRDWLMIVAFSMVVASSVGYLIAWGATASLYWFSWVLLVLVMIFGVSLVVWSVLTGMSNTEAELRMINQYSEVYWEKKEAKNNDTSRSRRNNGV